MGQPKAQQQVDGQMPLFGHKEVEENNSIYQDNSDNVRFRIKQLRKNILVHSCIYYRFSTSLISDRKFDSMCQELVELQEKHSDISQEVAHYDAFKNFDGSTGFDLPINEMWVVSKANYLLKHFQ